MTTPIDSSGPIVGFQSHPAALNPSSRLPAYRMETVRAPALQARERPGAAHPGLERWSSSDRFAQPGPAELFQPLLDIVVSLAPPRSPDLSTVRPPAPLPPAPPAPREADKAAEPEVVELPEPMPERDWGKVEVPADAVPEPVAFPEPLPEEAEAEFEPLYPLPPPAKPVVQPHWYDPEPEVLPAPAHHTLEEALDRTDEPAHDTMHDEMGEHTSVPLSAPLEEDWRGPRSESQLPVDATDAEEELWEADDLEEHGRPRFGRPAFRQSAFVVCGVVAAALVVFIAVRLLPSWLGGDSVTAVFNAPMMVVRAAVAGRATVVAANPGQIVDPTSPLLTIHTNEATNADKPVLAGVHGLIRSVDTVPGADLSVGAPLVRIHDCDRAFLTIPSNTKLRAGQPVQVKLPTLPTFAGTVRPSAGIMEPPDTLVVGLQPGAAGNVCPVGATATVTPAISG